MIFYCPGDSKYKVAKTLEQFGGQIKRYEFTNNGMISWVM